MELDTLTVRDAPAAHRLSTQAGWSVREREWRRMLATPGVHGFAGRIDGDLVATVSVVAYPGNGDSHAIAWIGSLVVDEAHRRQGYGTQIFDAALADATERATVVGLDANGDGRSLYEDAGFLAVAPAEKWHGILDVPARDATTDPAPSLDEIAALDARVCGVDRRNALRALLDDPDSRTFGERDGDDLRGYAVARPAIHGWTIGPLVAADLATAEDLLAAIADEIGDDPAIVNAAGNPATDDLFLTAGLSLHSTLARMTYDIPARPLIDDAIWANPGFAWG